MSVLRLFDIQTKDNQFTLVVSPAVNGGFDARYWSTPRNSGVPSRRQRQLSGHVTHSESAAALIAALDEIDANDGPLVAVDESLLTGERISILRELTESSGSAP